MKILYGISGDGFGHSSRAKTVGKHLKERGYDVLMVSYGCGYEALGNEFNVVEGPGLKLVFRGHDISRLGTAGDALQNLPKNIKRLSMVNSIMRDYNPDICISDMEPSVAWLSKFYSKRLVSLDNQHRLTNLEIKVPVKYKKAFMEAKGVIKSFTGRADDYIIMSFGEPGIKKKYAHNTHVVPPIIRSEVKDIKTPTYDGRNLVYLTRENEKMVKALSEIDDEFVVFGYNKNEKCGNLEFRTKDSFLEELANCKSVIATAGSGLISESLFLKKPNLAVPLRGQFEQILNALFLKDSGLGGFLENMEAGEIKEFLANREKYLENLNNHNPAYNKIHEVLDSVIG